MKKLIIIGIVVVVLVGGIFGGTVLAGKPADKPPIGEAAIMMDSGGGNLTVFHDGCGDIPVWVSPEYEQTRHISVTLYVEGCDFDPSDRLRIRTYFRNSDGTPACNATVLEYLEGYWEAKTIEFDATRWDIIACEGNPSDPSDYFEFYFSYTTIYPVVD
jgi:hypothetical protein